MLSWPPIRNIILFFLVILTIGFVSLKEKNSEDTGDDLSDLSRIRYQAEKLQGLQSLILLKGNTVVEESYYNGYNPDSLSDVRSVTKSVVGLLVGIALDKGIISSLDQSVGELLKRQHVAIPKEYNLITIRHLLTMTSGIDWDESKVSTYNRWVTSKDPIAYLLKKEVLHEPGSKFTYNSASTHLLSVILTEISGLSTFDFAQRYLFEPLNITHVDWQKIGGYYNGGAGLRMKPVDMLKIGRLVAEEGMYDGHQVISKSWIKESTDWQLEVRQPVGYGYLWWIRNGYADKNVAALGYGGQMIAILPKLNIVAVATSDWKSDGREGAVNQQKALEKLLKKWIYPYLTSIEDVNKKAYSSIDNKISGTQE